MLRPDRDFKPEIFTKWAGVPSLATIIASIDLSERVGVSLGAMPDGRTGEPTARVAAVADDRDSIKLTADEAWRRVKDDVDLLR